MYSYSLLLVITDTQGFSYHINVMHTTQQMLDTYNRYQSLAVHRILSKRFNDNISRCNLFLNKFILPNMQAIFYLLLSAWSNISRSHEEAVKVTVILMNQRKMAAFAQFRSLVTGIKPRSTTFSMQEMAITQSNYNHTDHIT